MICVYNSINIRELYHCLSCEAGVSVRAIDPGLGQCLTMPGGGTNCCGVNSEAVSNVVYGVTFAETDDVYSGSCSN
jgi:hypothetical protein